MTSSAVIACHAGASLADLTFEAASMSISLLPFARIVLWQRAPQ
jgi:hypothetical protein